MDFGGSWEDSLVLIEFSYTNSYHSSIDMLAFEALYGRKCRLPLYWDGVGERIITGSELVQATIKMMALVRERLKTAQDRQKSWADLKRRPLEFQEEDKLYLRISPMRGVMQFGKRGKLSARYVGLFEILDRVGELAYKLALPPSLSRVHNVFHVLQLRKYVFNPSYILEYEPLMV